MSETPKHEVPGGTSPEFMRKTDWDLLAQQKRKLLEMVSLLHVFSPEISVPCTEAIDGVVGFLDAAMDSAADDFGLYEFPDEYEEVP